MFVRVLILLGLLGLFGWVDRAHAAESYDNCTGYITSLPAVINTSGTWCLKQDLATSLSAGIAISINANNVTIDCNDFKLGGLGAGVGTSMVGIYANARFNETVRHCNVRGFFYGVLFQFTTGGGHIVEDNRFEGNTAHGIFVQGDGSVVRRNRVLDTGGSSFTVDALAIEVAGSVDVLDNTVSGVMARTGGGGNAFGITTTDNADGSIGGNRVRGLLSDGAGVIKGISVISAGRSSIHDNELFGNSSTGSIGLTCGGTDHNAKDNVITGFVSGIETCYDGGNLVRL